MKRWLSILTALLAGGAAAGADPAATETNAAPAGDAQAVTVDASGAATRAPSAGAARAPNSWGEIEPTRNLRDPFSPPGYLPPVPTTMTAAGPTEPLGPTNDVAALPEPVKAKPVTPADIWAHVRIGSIVKIRGKYYAYVNGMLMQAGEVFVVDIDGQKKKYIIRSINLRGIQIEPVNK